ncbi:MAG: phosphate/phosphite/phosphonate ABC transporter substrate-binding protein [Spirochaetes bacterium]|jgi:phosphonate transport system substrate-binding protein|nr:phosphate/phosphite/phosphonate ABC transporter substrate-binding protein [Spirochaetota bacterium]
MKRTLLLASALVLVAGGLFAAGEQEAAELGTDENPLIWSFVPSGDTQEIVAGGEEVADMIYDRTGIVIDVSVATEYAGVIEALSSDPPSAHIASLATFSYVLAADRGVAEAALVAVRFGSPTYNGQIIAQSDSDITDVTDLDNATFARPDPLSTSGWIIPMLTMRSQGINPEEDLDEIVDAGGHSAVVAAVYNGDVDAGATYVDARGTIEEDNPDVMEEVRVIAISEDIPNDGVQFHPSVPQEMRDQIVDALLEIADTEEGTEALNRAYSWTGLVKRDDTFYDPFRQVLQASGLDIEDLTE